MTANQVRQFDRRCACGIADPHLMPFRSRLEMGVAMHGDKDVRIYLVGDPCPLRTGYVNIRNPRVPDIEPTPDKLPADRLRDNKRAVLFAYVASLCARIAASVPCVDADYLPVDRSGRCRNILLEVDLTYLLPDKVHYRF